MENKVECSRCNVEVANFYQLPCGKSICKWCIDDVLSFSDEEEFKCPFCSEVHDIKFQERNNDDDENLYKDVRTLLNKLTSVNLQKFTVTLINLPITNEERLVNVVEIIYEKAISETVNCQNYAKLSKYLLQVCILFVRTIYTVKFTPFQILICIHYFNR